MCVGGCAWRVEGKPDLARSRQIRTTAGSSGRRSRGTSVPPEPSAGNVSSSWQRGGGVWGSMAVCGRPAAGYRDEDLSVGRRERERSSPASPGTQTQDTSLGVLYDFEFRGTHTPPSCSRARRSCAGPARRSSHRPSPSAASDAVSRMARRSNAIGNPGGECFPDHPQMAARSSEWAP